MDLKKNGASDTETFTSPAAAAKFAAYKRATGCTEITTSIQSNQRRGRKASENRDAN